MLDALKPYKILVEVLLVLSLVGAVAAAIHHYNSWQQGIGESRVQAAWDRSVAEQKELQRTREVQLQKDKDDALAQAAQARQQAASAAVAAANTGRLFNDAIGAIRAGSSTASVDALRANVAALTAVLPECERRYRAVAADADGHAADSLMLQRAWPKNLPTNPTK